MKPSFEAKVMSSFWLVFAGMALSLAWMLPNHVMPWYGFHGDAWCALMLTVVAVPVFLRSKFLVRWHWLPLLVAAVAIIPWAQFGAGMVLSLGTAWINSAYLLGFLLALLVGATWEKESPSQAGDYLFLAVGLASVASVGLQLHQLFDLEPFGPWTLQSSGTRHYANMAQPNQLCSLLLLGLLACAWGYLRQYLSAKLAIAVAALILVGVALTESRTGWLNIILLVLGFLALRRRLAPSKGMVKVVLGLALFFVACVLVLPGIYEMLWGESAIKYRPPGSDPRWAAWIMFFKAAVQKPLFGFGWGQLGQAQFLMLDEGMWLGASMIQSHNLILDLVLWNGLAVGLGIVSALAWWCWTVVRRVNTLKHWTMMSFVMVLGTHAMLEYPLQYAYFLLPVGLIMGCLHSALGFGAAITPARWLNGGLLVLGVAMLGITIRDYLRVETSFYGLRFEHKKVETSIPRTPPEVIGLTQLRDYIALARMEPTPGMTPEELQWVKGVVTTVPSAFVLYRFAAMLALNDKPADAGLWLKRLCQTAPRVQCDAIRDEWAKQSLVQPKFAAIPWPAMPN